ncbi:MAG TPA: DUF4129 domain-containing protein [Pyrinomonadaceae bacterium]
MKVAREQNPSRPRVAVAFAATLAVAAWLGVIVAPAARAQANAQAKRTTTAVADYRERVEQAASSLDALAVLSEEARSAAGGEEWAREEVSDILPGLRERTLRETRARVPPSERVERGDGGTLEVDNRWLHTELTRYERLPADDLRGEAGEEVVELAAERLRALGERLKEFEEGAAAAGARRDKEAEKGRLAEILRGRDFAERGARGGALARIFESVVKWLRDLLPDWQPLRPGVSEGASLVAQIVIYALSAGLLGYVAWRFWRRQRGGMPARARRREPRVVLGERLAPDETTTDLLAEAERLARAGDTRGAIRKAYVALLCELGERRVVRLAQNKTNRDYLHAVREHAAHLYGLFHPLTLSFERHWYGVEDATETDWQNFRTECRRAIEAR